MFERTVPSAASTEAAVSSQDVSIPRIGPGTHCEMDCLVVVVMRSCSVDWASLGENDTL